jgi:predicted phosphate transport protein (TIGR00153 family)
MKIPFISMRWASPFNDMLEHAEKVKECGWAFQQAIECYCSEECQGFEEYRGEVARLESEADTIKRRIRGHIPKGTRMPVSKFEIFWYIKEQDKVLDGVQKSLDWLSFRRVLPCKEELKNQLLILVDSVMEPIEDLSRLVEEAKKYFNDYSQKQRIIVKDIINNIRRLEHESDKIEDEFKIKIFSLEKDPVSVFHMIRLVETIGSIADHAENASDMMRAMIAR